MIEKTVTLGYYTHGSTLSGNIGIQLILEVKASTTKLNSANISALAGSLGQLGLANH